MNLSLADIVTPRLLLRRWRESDLKPFANMNADPRVMEFFPSQLSKDESDALAARIQHHFDQHGFGLWAVEIPGVTNFAGFIGLSSPTFNSHFTPCVEIGWRLSTQHWGCGFATEGSRSVLQYAFGNLQLSEVVSMTTMHNARSRRVMERIGMKSNHNDDFDHPLTPANHRLSRHVLYRLSREQYRQSISNVADVQT